MTRGRGAGAKKKVKPPSPPLNATDQQVKEEIRDLKLENLREKLVESTQIVNGSQTGVKTPPRKKKFKRRKNKVVATADSNSKPKSQTDVQAEIVQVELQEPTEAGPVEPQAEPSVKTSKVSIPREASTTAAQTTKSTENHAESEKHKKPEVDKNEVPLGFVLIPKDSEPLIEDADAYLITWAQCFHLRTCSSVVFFESCLIYYFLPINLILSVVFLIWSYNERVESRVVFLNYSPMPISTLISLIGLHFLITSILLSFATCTRRGMLIILSAFSILLGLVLFSLLSMFLVVYSSEDEVVEYLEEIFDAYQKEGQEKMTKVTDLLHRQFECCGIINATYWIKRTTKFPARKFNLPHTCCESFYLRKTKHSDDSCYKTSNDMDKMFWNQHKKGCAKELLHYFRRRSKLQWALVISGCIVTVLCLIFTVLYLIRLYANLSNHVHPKTRTLVDEIVEKAEDDIFGSGFENDAYDADVKDFVKFHLSRCHTIDEVMNFLAATADVRTYMRSLGPAEFARDILSRNEELLVKFETVLIRLAEKKEAIDRQMFIEGEAAKENQDKLLRLERTTRNWKNMKRKIILLRRFTTKLNEFVETEMRQAE